MKKMAAGEKHGLYS